MNNPKTEEIVKIARGCAANDTMACYICEYGKYSPCNAALLAAVADRLEEREAELAALKEKQRWIPVTERLPEDGKECLIWATRNYAELVWYDPGHDVFCAEYCDYSLDEITHWMPLPVTPKEEE